MLSSAATPVPDGDSRAGWDGMSKVGDVILNDTRESLYKDESVPYSLTPCTVRFTVVVPAHLQINWNDKQCRCRWAPFNGNPSLRRRIEYARQFLSNLHLLGLFRLWRMSCLHSSAPHHPHTCPRSVCWSCGKGDVILLAELSCPIWIQSRTYNNIYIVNIQFLIPHPCTRLPLLPACSFVDGWKIGIRLGFT